MLFLCLHGRLVPHLEPRCCRIVSSRDYEVVLEIIMGTTHRLTNASMSDLMQIRRDLSKEIALFLLSFTSALQSDDPARVGERVVEYAGQFRD